MYKVLLAILLTVGLINLIIIGPAHAQEPDDDLFDICSSTNGQKEGLTLEQEGDNGSYRATFMLVCRSDQNNGSNINNRSNNGQSTSDENDDKAVITFVELANKDGDRKIFSEHININPTSVAYNELPAKITLEVNLAEEGNYQTGQYVGYLTLSNKIAQGGAKYQTLPIYLHVSAPPKLEVTAPPPPIRIKTQIRTIPFFPNKQVARHLLLSEESKLNDVVVLDQSILLLRSSEEDEENPAPSRGITVNTDLITITRGSKKDFPVVFEFEDMFGTRVGQFQGHLMLLAHSPLVTTTHESFSIPVEMTIKHGLCLPVVLLLLSIVVGLFIRSYTIERQERDKLLKEIEEAEEKLKDRKEVDNKITPFYEVYGALIARQLEVVKDNLKQKRPNSLKNAKQLLNKFDELQKFSLTSEFETLAYKKNQIDMWLAKLDEVFPRESIQEYGFAVQIRNKLKGGSSKLTEDDNLKEHHQAIKQSMDASLNSIKDSEKPLELILTCRDFKEIIELINKESSEDQAQTQARVDQDVEDGNGAKGAHSTKDELEAFQEELDGFEKTLKNAFKLEEGNAQDYFQLDQPPNDLETTEERLDQIEPELREKYQGDWDKALEAIKKRKHSEDTPGNTPSNGWKNRDDKDRVISNEDKSKVKGFIKHFLFLGYSKHRLRYSGYQFLLAIVTLCALAYLGLIEIYFKNPTFGSHADYATLITWGFVANATQEGIFQLVEGVGAKARSRSSNIEI